MNLRGFGKIGVRPSGVSGLSVAVIVNVSSLPCLSELSATVTVIVFGASGVNVMELVLKVTCDSPSPSMPISRMMEPPAAMLIELKEIMAEVPSGMTW